MEMNEMHDPANAIESVLRLIEQEKIEDISAVLDELYPAEIANVIEAMPIASRQIAWAQVPTEMHADVLSEISDEAMLSIVSEMPTEELIAAAANMESNDLAEIMEELSEELGEEIKSALSEDILERLETNLTFEEGTAGRLMSSDFITVRGDVSVLAVIRYLRLRDTLPENTDCLMVINRSGTYLGKLPLQNILMADEDADVESIMQTDDKAVQSDMEERELAIHFEDRDILSVAVVNAEQKLIGRITVDDVLDIIREEANRAVMSGSGLDDEADLFAPVKRSVRSRSLWLGINLATAFLASWVIGLFEATIEQVVALAVLMPVVASMGGIAGSQTLALIMRGQALNQISRSNSLWLMKKEVMIGLYNGLLWSVVIAVVTAIWFKSVYIGLIIGMAIIITLIAAAFSGFAIPVLLKKIGVDPALSGAVILTTVTDVVGFMSFLGLATLFLM